MKGKISKIYPDWAGRSVSGSWFKDSWVMVILKFRKKRRVLSAPGQPLELARLKECQRHCGCFQYLVCRGKQSQLTESSKMKIVTEMRMDTRDMVRWYNFFHNGIEAVVLKWSRDREALTLTHVEHWRVFNYDDEDSCVLRAFCARHCPCYKHLAWFWFIHLSKLLRNCCHHFINKEGKVEDEVIRPVTFSKYH